MNRLTIDTPVGKLELVGEAGTLTAANYVTALQPDDPSPELERAAEQLAEYFGGERQTFDLALAPVGTEFQQEVWAALCEIPFGATCTYADIAHKIGRPGGSRAVGQANGRNPISIIIPCHRVVARGGGLGGYTGGLDKKRLLLDLEQRVRGFELRG